MQISHTSTLGSKIHPVIGASKRQAEILGGLENIVRELIASHEEKRELWFPSDLLSDLSESARSSQLRQRASEIPDPIRLSIALILLTEEGLPHFHRLIATRLGEDSFWQEWNNLWTAEEDRHGIVIRDYCRATGIFQMSSLERLQFAYLRSGFRPRYRRDPYTVFVYTTLQERATQIAHTRTAELAERYEPTISSILARVASEEARHFAFYRKVFAEIIKLDPHAALDAAAIVMQAFDMPGRSIPGFSEMAEVVRRSAIYGPSDYVEILREQIRYWGIESIIGLDESGRRRQQQILDLPRNITRLAECLHKQSVPESFSFDFLCNRSFRI